MDPVARKKYNDSFTIEKYNALLAQLEQNHPGQLGFRIAETPVFIPLDLKNKILKTCDEIIKTIKSDAFKVVTERAIPAHQRVPNENEHSSFLAIDFAICKDEKENLIPQLIELQGFPSLFAYQANLSRLFQEYFDVDAGYDYLFDHQSISDYVQSLRHIILGTHEPENVVLMDIYPEKQHSRIDFSDTTKLLGIKTVCYSKITKRGRKLYYEDQGIEKPIYRIYNRLIFDDLEQYPTLSPSFKLNEEVDVEWVGHPNWFFRISKFALPYLKGAYIPETKFLNQYQGIYPTNLDDYVLKPLYSFAGSGVELHVTPEMLDQIQEPNSFILQKKVQYEPIIQAPDGLVKCEIRMMYGWEDQAESPTLLISLSRLSRGEMIGVKFNKDFTWVGGSASFYPSLL
jgi:hypothetical protein